MTFGEIIKRERIKKGFSMEKLAKESGVGKSTIYSIEHNSHFPLFSTRKLICDALGIDWKKIVDELLCNAE